MAIKERLLKQLNIVWDGLRAMPPFHSRDLQAMRNALLQARDLCFQGLSENRFAEYKDTFDGLLLAEEQLAADAPDKEEIVSLCSELLQYMIAQTQKETAFKKEIFFLPYKASMWDSLESVWKAADEDKEHCIACVMPIPYADLTPEHTVAEWHCERELFPRDVPTVNWEDFNLQEIHPDVIFIHNPYDAYNRVTSVEARYYSDNLKKCTDKLVYIPYFVTGKGVMPHFCQTTGVLNADYVIVENEKIKKIYEENYPGGAPPEGKFLALGSPKYDKVLVSKKEEYPLPEEWEHLIEGRKIILYNTSLQAQLMHPDYILSKLQSVLLFFKQHRNFAFWWRPHPLMEATLDSMIPQSAEGYRCLRDQYLREHWGIYDDTPDLDRAIVWSDAYYGDKSSVIELYKKTGKPIMIQNFETVCF